LGRGAHLATKDDLDLMPTNPRRRLEEAADKLEIREVLARWNRGLDRADAELMRSTYHPDAIEEHGIHHYIGPEAADDCIRRHVAGTERHMHTTVQATIELDGDLARCESHWVAYLTIQPAGHAAEAPGSTVTGPEQLVTCGGRFLDRFERRPDEWKIAHRKMILEWRTLTNSIALAAAMPDSELGFSVLPYEGFRSTEDPSYAFFGLR
jgi:ketosteroid isomerase-like protein